MPNRIEKLQYHRRNRIQSLQLCHHWAEYELGAWNPLYKEQESLSSRANRNCSCHKDSLVDIFPKGFKHTVLITSTDLTRTFRVLILEGDHAIHFAAVIIIAVQYTLT